MNVKISTNKINWYPGHMAKAKREISENINLIDVVFELLDARIPLSSKIDFDELTKNKTRILIFTKYDLCDKEKTDELIAREYPEVPHLKVNLLSDKINKDILKLLAPLHLELNKKRSSKGLKQRNLRALVIGGPNIGKSSFINNLVSKKATKVANIAGVTKTLSWIRINKDIELLDSPGLLLPKLVDEEQSFKLAALGLIKEDLIPKEKIVNYLYETLMTNYPNLLKEHYNFDSNLDLEENFSNLAKERGFLKSGGLVDISMVYDLIYRDINNGIIKNITLD